MSNPSAALKPRSVQNGLMTDRLVVPGQVIATTSLQGDNGGDSSESFLRGHGTYLEEVEEKDGGNGNVTRRQRRLVAAVTGTVVRVNRLVIVEPTSSSRYDGNVGDLVVGRITAVGNGRWNVQLSSSLRSAGLPLSGVHLPGGVQRVRTQEDALMMRSYLAPGDLVSAEVHKIMQHDGTLSLHTRSIKYGKLENGISVEVQPTLIPRLAQHSLRLFEQFDLLLGCNGRIWIQRKMPHSDGTGSTDKKHVTSERAAADGSDTITSPSKLHQGHQELAEFHEEQQKIHRETPCSLEERRNLSRLRNSILALSRVYLKITPENIRHVYTQSLKLKGGNGVCTNDQLQPSQMLRPEVILKLTEALMQAVQ